MTRFFKISLIIVFTVFIVAATPQKVLNEFSEDYLTVSVIKAIQQFHYRPKPINDTYSQNVFNQFLKLLDPNKQFLLKNDIEFLSQYEKKIDDEINSVLSYSEMDLMLKFHQKEPLASNILEFFNQAKTILYLRVKNAQKFYKPLLDKPFKFNQNIAIETDPDKLEWVDSPEALKKRWSKHLKYQTLLHYLSIVESDTDTKNVTESLVFDPKIEKQSRKKTKKDIALTLERMIKNNQELIHFYLDILANVHDPHTTYLPPQEKENFDINISGKLEGIGALLTEEDGFIKVVRIIPGSAASRQGDLGANDIILKVAQSNDDPIDTVAMQVKEAVKLIRGKKGTLVKLTVKKPDGQILIIPIYRDIVILEESYAKSYLIHHSNTNQNFGYIKLPSFYRDFANQSARNATNDIYRKVLELKKDAISGLILDLRNNGGGSLKDAINISGLFIKSGPIVQVRKNPKAISRFDEVYKDRDNNQLIYDGPLIILLNTMSASASEIVAAALQDYSRALIVGSPHSFGKGTVQTVLDLDKLNQFPSNFGSLKVTTQKFFRINGDTTQYSGVIPDIMLPDNTDFMEIGEKYLPFSIESTKTQPLNYEPFAFNKSQFISSLLKKSHSRIQTHKIFKKLSEYSLTRKTKKLETQKSLLLNTAYQKQQQQKKEAALLKKIYTNYSYLEFKSKDTHNPRFDPTREQDRVEILQKDPYLEETLSILNDLSQIWSDFVELKD